MRFLREDYDSMKSYISLDRSLEGQRRQFSNLDRLKGSLYGRRDRFINLLDKEMFEGEISLVF